MDVEYHPVLWAFLASLVTWMCTLLGASAVFLEGKRRFSNSLMECLFGLSAGVMLAASFFSLLAPALAISETLSVPAWVPLLSGFSVGAIFIKVMDIIVPEDPSDGCFAICIRSSQKSFERNMIDNNNVDLQSPENESNLWGDHRRFDISRPDSQKHDLDQVDLQKPPDDNTIDKEIFYIPKKMFLLALAVTIHNIPEGLVLGMAYGSIGHENGPKLHDAFVLTAALGLQNIPEGLAISIPIWRSGSRRLTSFCYGQLSGFVEVIASVLGALLVITIKVIMPYALSFAAGAMIYVVCKELIPASQSSQKHWGTFGIMLGFALMMTLDIAFG